MPIFQSIPRWNGSSKSINLVQKWKNAVFRNFSSFANEIDEKEQIQNLYWLIINSELGEPLAAAPEILVGGAPCRVPTWVERAKNKPVLKKI